MDDVIFAGSESRGPTGMAEVSLTFDARALGQDVSPGGVPWGAVGPEEVVVTRRLYRAGDSEYLLNGVPSRLRGRSSSSSWHPASGPRLTPSFEQGRIGFIVSSRPDDRRGLFDEAAGITKYKAKKKAAERRMDSTRQHLLRVSDIIGEIETRLRSLRLQAQKAERYKRYKAELRDIDLWSSSQRYLGFLAEEKSLTAEHADWRPATRRCRPPWPSKRWAIESEAPDGQRGDDRAQRRQGRSVRAGRNRAQLGMHGRSTTRTRPASCPRARPRRGRRSTS